MKKSKRTPTKIKCALSYQDKSFAVIAQRFVCVPSFSSFRNFGNECFTNMIKTVVGENDFSTLTITTLKYMITPNAMP